MDFSKLIHLCWFQGVANAPGDLARSPSRWAALNPGHEIRLWDERSLSALIANRYPRYFARWMALDMVIKKCDLARLLVIHEFGGAYFDLDLLPRRALDSFLDDGHVRYAQESPRSGQLPGDEASVRVKLREREFILSREYRRIDMTGYGVANGMIISRPRLPLWLEFIDERIGHARDARVLDFMGPHALTRFLRARARELRGRGALLPPYYFLWERGSFKHPPPEWCVAEHPAVNHWGDHTRPDWWAI